MRDLRHFGPRRDRLRNRRASLDVGRRGRRAPRPKMARRREAHARAARTITTTHAGPRDGAPVRPGEPERQ
eukprot:5137101-Pyramimonas_sp.AAC.1